MPLNSLVEEFESCLKDILALSSCNEDDTTKILGCVRNALPIKIEQGILDMIQRLSDRVSGDQEKIPESTGHGINDQIHSFIKWKRDQINKSNLAEFLGTPKPNEDACARLDILPINRSCQIKTAVVENWEGPLDRTTIKMDSTQVGKNTNSVVEHEPGIFSHLTPHTPSPPNNTDFFIEQRLRPIEEHLRLTDSQQQVATVFARIKRIEDKIIDIETNHPFLAFYHFNYPNNDEDTISQTMPSEPLSRKSSTRIGVKKSTEHNSQQDKSSTEEQTYSKLCGIKRKLLGNT